MKLTTILLLSACMQVSAAGYSQKVTLSESSVPLKKVFTEISKQTGYTFFCNEALLDNVSTVTVKLKEASLQSALDACLKEQNLTYTIVGSNIVIKEKEKTMSREIDYGLNPTSDPVPIPYIDVRGRVINEAGDPLVGATVHIKGTKEGATTNAGGYFIINVVMGNTIEISYVG